MAEDIRVTAFLHAAKGQEDAVKQAVLACVPPTRAEPGCELYALHTDKQDPSLFVLWEHWKSQQALDDHMQTPHFKTVAKAIDGKLAQPMIIHVLNPI